MGLGPGPKPSFREVGIAAEDQVCATVSLCTTSDTEADSLCPPKAAVLDRSPSVSSIDEGLPDPRAPSTPTKDREGANLHVSTICAAHGLMAGKYETGVRYFTDPASEHPYWRFFETAIVVLTTFGYMGFLHIFLVFMILSFFNRAAAILVAVALASVLLPAEPLRWPPLLNSPLLAAWRRYFQFSIAFDCPIDLKGKYIFAEFPHGVFPLSQHLAITLTDKVWPGMDIYSIAASSIFRVPMWRHVMSWIGARPATARNFKKLLKRGSVGLVPGGIAEMYILEEHAETVKIKDRKGFVRIAVEKGVPIVPVYHFGNSQLFRVPLFMVVGKPIPVKQLKPTDPGYHQAVDEAHAALVLALEELYYRYRGHYGWNDRPLIIH
eukprot:jgi/Chrzof1/13847/Cz08g14220.t1_DGAT2A[v5.2]